MKFFQILKNNLISPWVLGILITIPVILVIPDLFSRYKTTEILIEPAQHVTDYHIFFVDLDGNGKSQKVYSFENGSNQLSVQYFKDSGGMENQVNFSFSYSDQIQKIFFGDLNKNGFAEIYGFSINNDSLFINWFEPYPNHSNFSKSDFITTIGTYEDGKVNLAIEHFEICDLDSNGVNEILMSIVTGYSKHPRRLVLYNPVTKEKIFSPDLGINTYQLSVIDIPGNEKIRIIGGSAASFNLSDSLGNPVIDNRPYFLAFNSRLQFAFPPVPFSSGISNKTFAFKQSGKSTNIVVFQFNLSLPHEKIAKAYKLDAEGNFTDSTAFTCISKRFPFRVFQNSNQFIIYAGDKVFFTDEDFKILHDKKIGNTYEIYKNPNQTNNLPAFTANDLLREKAWVYTNDFKGSVEIEFKDEIIKDFVFGLPGGTDQFMILTDKNEHTYHFGPNKLYYLKFPLFLAVYILMVLFVKWMQKTGEKQLMEKYRLREQVRNMELKMLQSQMDPHFMFNAFTTMASLLKKGEQEEAYGAFMKFTKMVRSNFDFAHKLLRPLSEEIAAVSYYLEINKMRFKDNLSFIVEIAENVPLQTNVPKMMVQMHVENALKHGISKLSKPGRIDIKIWVENEMVNFSIADNGIGRQNAALLNIPSTKKGIKMLDAAYESLNLVNNLKISQKIIDLTDENNKPLGTLIRIEVPLNLRE